MKKSIRNKIAIMLALFGTIGQKTYANKLGYAIAGVATMGMIGMAGLCSFFYGKAKDENNKKKYQESSGDGQHDIIVNRPSKNPNSDDLLKNKIKNILDNGVANETENYNNLKKVFDAAYSNHSSFWNFDDDVQTENSVSIVRCKFDENDNITETITYKFILENEKQVRVQKNVNKKMEYEIVVTI